MPEAARPTRKPRQTEANKKHVAEHHESRMTMLANSLATAALHYADDHWDQFFVEMELDEIEELSSDSLKSFFEDAVLGPLAQAVQTLYMLDKMGMLK